MKLLYITVSSVLIGVVAGFTWTSHTPNGTRITNCVGDNVTLHWSFETSPGEIIQSVRWFVYNEGAQAEKPLANYVFGVFFKMPSIKTRVELLANAGIQLFNVSARDFGTYVLRVSLSRNRFLVTEEQWAVISLPDKPVLAEGRLVAMVLPETRFSEDTQEHHVQLECGRVLNDDQSDISVVWTTPHGKTLESSYYKDGVFILLLPNPVVGGAYSCRLDKVSTNINCLRDDKALTQPSFVHVDGMASRLAVVEAGLRTLKQDPDVGVDGAQVRLKLLEASQQTLVQEKLLLTQRVRTLEASHQSLTDHVQSLEEGQVFLNESLAETQQALTDGDDSLDKKVENLEASQQSLTEDSQRLSGQMQSVEASQQSLTEEDSRLSKLIQTLTEDNGRLKEQNQKLTDQLQNVTTAIRDYNNGPDVAFTAYASAGTIKAVSGAVIILDAVITNNGGAYSGTTGKFTAPSDGLYFFHCSLEVDKLYSGVDMMLNGNKKVYAERTGDSDSGNKATQAMVLSLATGDEVYLTHKDGSEEVWGGGKESVFSGFKIK